MSLNAIKIILILIFTLTSVSSSLAFRVRDLPLASDAHIGFVTGVGAGINFGFNAGFDVLEVKIGPELEQIITDVDYTSGINATRFGGYIRYELTEVAKDLNINFHMGSFQLQVKERDIYYSSGSVDYLLLAGSQRYTGKYQALSVDIPWGEFKITPKFIVNTIDGGGSVNEFNLNLGREF
jgi:hypothetical protein